MFKVPAPDLITLAAPGLVMEPERVSVSPGLETDIAVSVSNSTGALTVWLPLLSAIIAAAEPPFTLINAVSRACGNGVAGGRIIKRHRGDARAVAIETHGCSWSVSTFPKSRCRQSGNWDPSLVSHRASSIWWYRSRFPLHWCPDALAGVNLTCDSDRLGGKRRVCQHAVGAVGIKEDWHSTGLRPAVLVFTPTKSRVLELNMLLKGPPYARASPVGVPALRQVPR